MRQPGTYTQAMKQVPDDAWLHVQPTEILFKQGKTDAALTAFAV